MHHHLILDDQLALNNSSTIQFNLKYLPHVAARFCLRGHANNNLIQEQKQHCAGYNAIALSATDIILSPTIILVFQNILLISLILLSFRI